MLTRLSSRPRYISRDARKRLDVWLIYRCADAKAMLVSRRDQPMGVRKHRPQKRLKAVPRTLTIHVMALWCALGISLLRRNGARQSRRRSSSIGFTFNGGNCQVEIDGGDLAVRRLQPECCKPGLGVSLAAWSASWRRAT